MKRLMAMLVGAALLAAGPAIAAKPDEGLGKLKHIIILFQENRSFDHYFGVLPYAPGSPYHAAAHQGSGACAPNDHACVDGLTCKPTAKGLTCSNWNAHADGRRVRAYHAATRCIAPDLDHEWVGSHKDANFAHPEMALSHPLNDGFVMQNDVMAPDTHRTGPADGGRAMAYYDQSDIAFYYDVAEKFAISDRYFGSILGSSDPNHAFHLAGTFFGHLTDEEKGAPSGGYKPLRGTIYGLLTRAGVDWAESFQDAPEGVAYLGLADPHFIRHAELLDRLRGKAGAKALPSVVWVNARIGLFDHGASTNNEHPSSDIQRGQAWVSALLNDLRHGPYWKDSVVLITYDEAGGYYDHVRPPRAPQMGARTPDGLEPGACADATHLPQSAVPGHGAQCLFERKVGTTYDEILQLCPQYDPARPYPAACPSYDQLGFRAPLMVISPFARKAYVSHRVADHSSLLALIEARFLTGPDGRTQHLTKRDAAAWTLVDMFDFARSPSLRTELAPPAGPPAHDCSPTTGTEVE
jgi:phospholipase C